MSLFAVILTSLSSSMIQPTSSWPAFTPSTTTTPTPSPSSCTTKWIIHRSAQFSFGWRYSSRIVAAGTTSMGAVEKAAGEQAWTRESFAGVADYSLDLTQHERGEILAAL